MTRTPTPSVTPSVAVLTICSSIPIEVVARYSKYRSAYSPPAESASLKYDSRSRSVMLNRWPKKDSESPILRAYHAELAMLHCEQVFRGIECGFQTHRRTVSRHRTGG